MTRALIAWLGFVIGLVFITVAAAGNEGHRPNGLSLLGLLLLVLWAYLIGVFTRRFWFPGEAENARCDDIDQQLTKEGR